MALGADFVDAVAEIPAEQVSSVDVRAVVGERQQ